MPRGFDGGLSPAFGKGQPARKCPEARRSLSVSLSAFGSKADARRGLARAVLYLPIWGVGGRRSSHICGSEIIGGPHAPKRFIHPRPFSRIRAFGRNCRTWRRRRSI